jgi:hypothetical protein
MCSSWKETIQNPHRSYLEIMPVLQSTPLECTPGETRCCRQGTTVSLRQVTPRIIHPRNIQAFYCRGTCEGSTNNSYCCVPTKTTPLSILSVDHERHVTHNVLPDVVIQQCGCR